MLDRPRPAVRKADTVAHDILRGIVGGEWPVGSILPKEADLAVQHGVTRGVVREAVKLLEVHGLVRPVRRRGTEVLDPWASLSPEVLRAMLVPEPGRVDKRILGSVLEVRASLDELMTGLAAQRRSRDDITTMRRLVAELRKALGNRETYERLSEDLSLAVARATQNPIFVMLVRWHQAVAAELSHIFRTVRPASEPHWQGVDGMVQLIAQGDDEAARELVRTFHAWATPRLLAAASLGELDDIHPNKRGRR